MKAIILAASAALLAMASLGATAAPADRQPQQAFNDLGVTMQSRVCGELMASLALGGVQALQMQSPNGPVPVKQRQPVYETSAQAVVLLSMSGSLKLEERLKAGELAQAIEKLDPQVHVDTAAFCQRRVRAWIDAGQVSNDMVAKAYSQAKKLMDPAFNSAGQQDDGR